MCLCTVCAMWLAIAIRTTYDVPPLNALQYGTNSRSATRAPTHSAGRGTSTYGCTNSTRRLRYDKNCIRILTYHSNLHTYRTVWYVIRRPAVRQSDETKDHFLLLTLNGIHSILFTANRLVPYLQSRKKKTIRYSSCRKGNSGHEKLLFPKIICIFPLIVLMSTAIAATSPSRRTTHGLMSGESVTKRWVSFEII